MNRGKNSLIRRWKGRRGATLLEAALVLAVLLPLTFGMVEFSYFFYLKHVLQGAAREGCRAAIVSGATNSTVTTAVSTVMTLSNLQSSGYTITLTPTDVSTASVGSQVTVKVECTWGNVGVRPMSLISSTKKVTGQTAMRKES